MIHVQSVKRNSPAQNNEEIYGDGLDDIPIGELTILNRIVTKASASEKISHETDKKRRKRGHNENRKKDNTDKKEHRFSIFAQSESEEENEGKPEVQSKRASEKERETKKRDRLRHRASEREEERETIGEKDSMRGRGIVLRNSRRGE